MQNSVKSHKPRDLSVDAAGGLLIIWMIFGHVMTWAQIDGVAYQALRTAMSFYLGWFFFKGGLFAKKAQNETDYLRVSLNRLILPFILFSVIGMLFYWLDIYLLGEKWSLRFYFYRPLRYFLHRGSSLGNLPLWFLLTLFFVRTLFQRLVRFQYADYLLAAVIVLLYLVKYLDVFGIAHHLKDPLYLYNPIVGLFFFWVGYRLKQRIYDRRIFIVSLVILLPLLLFVRPNYFLRTGIAEGDFMVFLLTAITECIVFSNLFKLLYRRFNMRFLVYVGEHAMEYFCTHWILLYIIHIFVIIPFDITSHLALFCIYFFGLIMLLPVTSALLAKAPIRL